MRDDFGWILEGLDEQMDRDGVMVSFFPERDEVFVGRGPADPERLTLRMDRHEQVEALRALRALMDLRELIQ